jgi:hypothetical protein
VRQLGDLPGHLDTSGARADHDESQPGCRGIRVGLDLSELERAEDSAAQLERVVQGLHARCVVGEVVVTEVGNTGSCGHDEAVVWRLQRAARSPGRYRPGLDVDVDHFTESHLGIALATKDFSRRWGDRAFGEDSGGYLVEQRLEQVVVGLGDHRDIHRCILQRLGGEEPAETRADDHHMVTLLHAVVHGHRPRLSSRIPPALGADHHGTSTPAGPIMTHIN